MALAVLGFYCLYLSFSPKMNLKILLCRMMLCSLIGETGHFVRNPL